MGSGAVGRVEGRSVAVGNTALLRELGVDALSLEARLRAMRERGQTAMLVAIDGKLAGALAVAEHDFGLSAEEIQEAADRIPAGGSAVVALFEHTWAIRLKEYILDSGGFLVAQGLIHPSALVEVGAELAAAAELEQMLELEEIFEEELEDLEYLHLKGTLTQAEYEAKKSELESIVA